MDFSKKIEILEQARKDYPEFDAEFLDLLGRGYSFVGAYDHFSVDHANKYKKEPARVVTAPVTAAKKVIATPTPEPIPEPTPGPITDSV
jgi:hypothetical protein